MATQVNAQSKTCKPHRPCLPTELWLQILENTSIHEAEHLWIAVRQVSRQFQDYVERLFISTYLPQFAISLSLPRRSSRDGTQRCWPGTIPNAQIIMSFAHMTSEERFVTFISPVELGYGDERESVEELRVSGVLPKARLLEAPAWVYLGKNYMAGRPLRLAMDIEWDRTRQQWVWSVEWRKLVSRFYRAKLEARTRVPRQTCHAKRKNAGRRPL
jgi:hypothetical protein